MSALRIFLGMAILLLTASCVRDARRAKAAKPVGPGNSSVATKLAAPSAPLPEAPTGPWPDGTPITWRKGGKIGSYIAFTIDDGPHRKYTPQVLDLLKQRGIKATFFTIGELMNSYPDIIRRMMAEGHEIANHTWTHQTLSQIDDGAARLELQKSHDIQVKLTGQVPRMFRPPGGGITSAQKEWIMKEFGYPCIMWDVDPQDWKTRNAAKTKSRILAQTGPGSIVLVHDIHAATLAALPGTLDGLLAKGFSFITMSQLIALNAGAGGEPAAAMPLAATALGGLSTIAYSPGSF